MKKSTSNNFITIISLIIVVGIFIWFNNTYSENKIDFSHIISPEETATLSIISSDEVQVNRPFTTTIVLDTNGNSVNAVGLQMIYPTTSLKVSNIDTSESFCQFYPEKKINDTDGTIALSCGSPSPGFSGENNVIKIEFTPTKIGPVNIIIKDSSKILLSDGKGTNILSEFPSKKIVIQNSL